jgi:hypothetical protein
MPKKLTIEEIQTAKLDAMTFDDIDKLTIS